MVNKSKNKGTAAETAVVRYAKANGFPDAQRLPLMGSKDIGDVRLTDGIHLEVKAGERANSPSPALVVDWLEEARNEARNAGPFVECYLVTKRKGYGSPKDWRVHVWDDQLFPLILPTVGGLIPPGSSWEWAGVFEFSFQTFLKLIHSTREEKSYE